MARPLLLFLSEVGGALQRSPKAMRAELVARERLEAMEAMLSSLLPKAATLQPAIPRIRINAVLRRGVPTLGAYVLGRRLKWLRFLRRGPPTSPSRVDTGSLRKLLLNGRKMASHTGAGL